MSQAESEYTKLYVLVRNDLKPGLATAQACHAVAEFSLDHLLVPEWQSATWAKVHKTMVILALPPAALLRWEQALANQHETREGYKDHYSLWREPDMGNELTAIAVLPKASKMF